MPNLELFGLPFQRLNFRDKYHKENQKAANRVAEKKKRQEEKALESDEEESDELRRLKELQKVHISQRPKQTSSIKQSSVTIELNPRLQP